MFFLFSLISWVISFIVHGVCFVLLLGAIGYWYIFTYTSKPIGDPSLNKRAAIQVEEDDIAKQNAALKAPDEDMVGMLIIRRTYEKPKDPLTFMGQPVNSLTATVDAPKNDQQTMAGRAAQAYRQLAATPTNALTDHYYCVLKGEVLYIYDKDGEDKECLAAIPMNKYVVNVENHKGKFEGMEGKFYTKKHCVVLRYADPKRKGLPLLVKGMSSDSNTETKEAEKAPWFIFLKNSNVRMEDWYFSLLNVAANKARHDHVFSLAHMKWLCDRVQSQPDPSGLQWLNAMLGRIFLGVNHTARVEQFIIDKINKKLSLINPPLVGPLRATEVNIGNIPPILSNAMLKDMKPNGEIVFEARIDYQQPADLDSSCTRVTIEATKLNFKAVIAAEVRSLSGNVRILIKPPPSDRIWWCFTEQPKMDIDIEPVVGPRAIKWGTLLSFIQKKMREGMAEAIIAPNMDDVPFFHTDGLDVRGGIFDVASRAQAKEEDEEEEKESSDQETEVGDDSSTPASSLRYRNGKGPARQTTMMPNATDNWAETHSVQRSETSPNLTTRKEKAKPKPSSLRSSTASAKTSRQGSTSTENSHFEIDKADKPPASIISSTADRSDAKSISTTSVHSVSPPSPVSLTTTDATRDSRDRSVSASTIETDPSKLTSAAILSAVRARDTATIEAQVSVAKQSVKKWGVNLMKKRNKRSGDHDDLEELSSMHSSLSASTSVTEIHAPTPRHDGRSLQERLNAAAAHARDHHRTPSASSGPPKSIIEKEERHEKEETPVSTAPSLPLKTVEGLAVPSRSETASTASAEVKSVASVESAASVKTQPALEGPAPSESTEAPIAPPSPDVPAIKRHDSDPLTSNLRRPSPEASKPVSQTSTPEEDSGKSHDLAKMFKSVGESAGETE